jgi:SAM-dependent methyltransferase
VNLPSLPSKSLLQAQSEWLAPARARLLRRVGIARRRRILDLGAGYGAVTGELVRRGGGFVAALDRVAAVFTEPVEVNTAADSVQAVSHAPGFPLCGDALSLPFADNSFDLVFSQCVLLWVISTSSVTGTSTGLVQAVAEIHRVLEPKGVLIALEPDYGEMIEYPPEIATKDIWLSALTRTGAEPCIGRKLPGMLAEAGFGVRVDLLDALMPPAAERFDFLRTLPLTDDEAGLLEAVTAKAVHLQDNWQQVVHLPFFLISATKN